MKLNNENIEVNINHAAEIISIKFMGEEILYQGDEGWKKQFPIIFPSLGFSTGFEHKGKAFDMPKHGFWKSLEWESFFEEGELLSVATLLDKDKYPFALDIVQRIGLDNNVLYVNYEISNLDKELAFFQFGVHPAFKIDDSSFISNIPTMNAINLEGKLTDEEHLIDELPVKSLPFGEAYDTLIAQNIENKKITLNKGDLKLNFDFDSPHLQVWKPKNDNFVCIEPWYGQNDSWYEASNEVSKKNEIISLSSGKTWSATFEIEIEKMKK